MNSDTTMTENEDATPRGGEQHEEQTRFVDRLDRIYDVIEEASEEAETQRENAALMMIVELTDYARAVGLQREFPTPNQKLNAAVGGGEPDNPEDPGHWREYIDKNEEWQHMVDWTHPEEAEDAE